ncbi:M48 family metallopeptidase [Thiohalomonas denitrificans]|uniref:Peptidase family M48 n=1 Tax=Thiohalomonas denitrificans TaxID=415747 RepID=A0A1G5QVL9_9GAMM|nr:M48 family metallopeptidase [Thiohalomonas denitrificans]SCZ65787.1 Peptidase family M48 [Thiohalomonas denitrificans]
MTAVSGWYYPAGSSRREPAKLHGAGGAVSVRVAGEQREPLLPAARVQVSDRLGNTTRFLTFPSGAKFETDDNAAIDALLPNAAVAILHGLESHWRTIALSLVMVAAMVFGVVRYGIPVLAERVAFALPYSINQEIDRGVWAVLDEQFFRPSRLQTETRERLTARFQASASRLAPDTPVRIVFRDAGHSIGPNALALPSGTIVFTDQLVALAETDEELLGIFVHELGHVVGRHGLRRGLQVSALTLVAVSVLGDLSAVSSLVGSLPLVLTELGYSRTFEREADAYAIRSLEREDVSREHFAAILNRLEQQTCPETNSTCEAAEWQGYLSTHPLTDQRVARIRGGE